MTGADIQPWVSTLALLISIGATLYIWLTAGTRNNAEQLEKLAHDTRQEIGAVTKRVEECERRSDRIEVDMAHMPGRDTVQRMELTLTEMRGQMGVLNERLVPVAAIADRLQEFLLEQHRDDRKHREPRK
ncbi:MAG: DUF2730 family protein [Gammaproteobacteria bacterium]